MRVDEWVVRQVKPTTEVEVNVKDLVHLLTLIVRLSISLDVLCQLISPMLMEHKENK